MNNQVIAFFLKMGKLTSTYEFINLVIKKNEKDSTLIRNNDLFI